MTKQLQALLWAALTRAKYTDRQVPPALLREIGAWENYDAHWGCTEITVDICNTETEAESMGLLARWG